MIFTTKKLMLCAALFGLATSANAAYYKITEMTFNVNSDTIVDNLWVMNKTYAHANLTGNDTLAVDGTLTLTMDLSNVEVGGEYSIALFGADGLPNILGDISRVPINFVDNNGNDINHMWTVSSPIMYNDTRVAGYFVKVKATSSIPEPTTTTLGLLGLGSLMLHRRRKQ